jgi:transcriptional regulator with XRE-family HTH domain
MTDRVLSEFIDAWNAGRRPRVRDYLARLPDGPERDELADAITDWLSVAPTPAYSEGTRGAIRAEVARTFELSRLRERAGFSPRELAARVAKAFGLSDVERTEGYLARLEAGELDPSRVSRRLLDALAGLLGGTPALRPAGGALFRAEDADATVRFDIELLSRAALSPAPSPMDELDRLFTGGPDA